MNNLISEDYLMHHGVKGMKWGVRRYQNADGTLNRRGLARQNEREKYIQKKQKSIAFSKREISNIKKQQKMPDKQYVSQFKDQIRYEMDFGELSRKDAEKEVLKYNRYEDSKQKRISEYQIKKNQNIIKSIKSTPIDKLSVVEASKRKEKILWGSSIAGATAAVGLTVALRKTGIITTGGMIVGGLGLGSAGFVTGSLVGNSKVDKHYKKKGIDTSL